MVCITNTRGEYDIYRHNPDSSPGIYMTVVMEAQCLIVSENWRKQDEVKQNAVQVNAIKIPPHHQVR